MSLKCSVLALLVLGACSHPAPRKNPLDPELTPPVEVAIAVDDSAGAVTLAWTPYDGQAAFGAYWVLRNILDRERVDTLAVIADRTATGYVDTALAVQTPYAYRVAVVNADGFEAASAEQRAHSLDLPPVRILEVDFQSATASAALTWTPYAGPRFAAYRVERRTAQLARQTVAEIADAATTTLTDRGLAGNTEYFYRVTVDTEHGEAVSSQEQAGSIHPLVAEWPLDLEPEARVRLYVERPGQITALVAHPRGIRLLFFSPDGVVLGEQVLLEIPAVLEPGTVSTAVLPDGRRLLSLASGEVAGTAVFTAEGVLVRERQELFPELVPDLPEGVEPGGSVAISASPESGMVKEGLTLDAVAVVQGEEAVFADDFSDPELPGWTERILFYDSGHALPRAQSTVAANIYLSAQHAEWRGIGLEADFRWLGPCRFSCILGTSPYALSLSFGPSPVQATLISNYRSTPERREDRRYESFTAALPGFFPVFGHHLSLGVTERRIRATLDRPVVLWQDTLEAEVRFTSMAGSGEHLVAAADNHPALLNAAGRAATRDPLVDPVSEIRMWERGARTEMGICLPEEHLVAIAQSGVYTRDDQLIWPFQTLSAATVMKLGAGAGSGGGELFYPLSFDGAADGRFYVLDAGNGRIQVFDSAGGYLTQWGKKGPGAGEFDFGSGHGAEDFAGSVCVDGERYIYVADVGNGRIQKFAP